MKRIINAYEGTCKNCHNYGKLATVNEDSTELSVCYRCGEIILKQTFDSRAYIKELLESGMDGADAVAEVLTDKLYETYDWMEDVDVEALAGLLVKSLYDDVAFEVKAEAQEATDFIREREALRIGAW